MKLIERMKVKEVPNFSPSDLRVVYWKGDLAGYMYMNKLYIDGDTYPDFMEYLKKNKMKFVNEGDNLFVNSRPATWIKDANVPMQINESLIKGEYNKLLKVRVDYQGNQQWYLKPEYTKKGSTKNKGHYIFRGTDDEFRKFLMRMKASDTNSDPASQRNIKYMDIIQDMKKLNKTYIWVYLSKWESSNQINR